MSKWKYLKLGLTSTQFIDGDRSKKYPARNDFLESGVLFLNGESINTGVIRQEFANYISEEKYAEITKGRIQQGDILLTTRGNSLGDCAIVKIPDRGLINAQMLILRPKSTEIASFFLFYYLRSNSAKDMMTNISSGSAQPQIPIRDLKFLSLPIPPLPIQQKIAAVLSAYDDLIENNDRRIALLEKMAEEIYREWFVRLRFPGHEQATFHKGIPEGWEIEKLGNICHLITDGKHGDCTDEVDSGYYFISAKDIKNGKINYANAREIVKADFEETHRRTNLKPNDILITNSGTIGRLAIASNARRTFRTTFQKSVAIVKPKADLVSTYFLYQTFIDKNDVLSDFASGTAQKNLLLGDLRKFKLLCPPFSLQHAFNQIITPVYSKIESFEVINHILRETRDRLLTRLISGKLSVEDLDIQFPPSMTTDP